MKDLDLLTWMIFGPIFPFKNKQEEGYLRHLDLLLDDEG